MARFTLRAEALHDSRPAYLLGKLNDVLFEQREQPFLTAVCVAVDVSGDLPRVTIACAGHPPALLVEVKGTVRPVGGRGTLLGGVREPHLEEETADLGRGDALVLYTDGLTEAHAPAYVLEPGEIGRALERHRGAAPEGIADALVEIALRGSRQSASSFSSGCVRTAFVVRCER